jgi:hypothetical protein
MDDDVPIELPDFSLWKSLYAGRFMIGSVPFPNTRFENVEEETVLEFHEEERGLYDFYASQSIHDIPVLTRKANSIFSLAHS